MLCRNKHDQVAFAVHAFMLADGYKLVATGKKADEVSEGEPFTSYSAVKSAGNMLANVKPVHPRSQCRPATPRRSAQRAGTTSCQTLMHSYTQTPQARTSCSAPTWASAVPAPRLV